jgi:putative membrane protein
MKINQAGWTIMSMALALTLTVGSALADETASTQGADTQMSQGDQSTQNLDQHLLSKLHEGNRNEIRMAKLALKKSKNPEVKSFAHRIIRDHSQADHKIMQVSKQDQIALQSPPIPMNDQEIKDMKEHHAQMKRLKSLKGSAFDQEYQSVMIKDHKKDIADLQQNVDKLQNENVKDLANSLIPIFEHHESLASNMVPNPNMKTG